ncbi:CHC2 zinc finger domain-containing protein [Variovorax sp. 38R]|uniref:CHC2 zinc finger domain-containing protein n=1 Tax=Variovorax sp. 38R TaxID=2774875 RepID=UPI001784D728|nr:CHC2 zinc finger domain-containing protein [Variovorax sp. 38R]QOF77613.1 toprim domain-containing protein [Variovorax sp. 38R]
MDGRYDVGDLLSKIPLEDAMQRLGMATERRGATTQALCPFHQDTRPSLNLYPADGAAAAHYHCFACGAHGSAIDLVKKVLGLEFLPAVQWLALQFGIKAPSRQSRQRAANAAASETALKFALRIYDEQHDDLRFTAWCAERDFDRKFLYGQGLRCITSGVLVGTLQSKSIGERAELTDGLQTLGLIKRLHPVSAPVQGKLNLHDQFQDSFHDGRVVIPIRGGTAKQPELLGFAGRALQGVPPEGVAKYLLTSGFEKAKVLFNEPAAFNAVKLALKAHLPAKLYLVEGFLDALRLQFLGLPAVALMGTSLGKEPMERLKKLAEESDSSAELAYILFLDNDPAGFGGTDRLVRRLLDLRGVNLRWVGMPWRSTPALGKDPDTCLRGLRTAEQATAWLQPFDLPAEAVLLAQALGGQDVSDLRPERFDHLVPTVRERALFRVGMALRRLYGARPAEVAATRLKACDWGWAQQLQAELAVTKISHSALPARGLYLEAKLPRVALARSLAYHGARRGELPCDEEAWQTLGGNARLFDQIALDRLKAMMGGARSWKQAAPFDAVHLPRKLTADPKVLDDPRRKVMPHPADLHVQQMVLNELLSQRHDRPSSAGQAFSDCIPAVRWYASRREVLVTSLSAPLNELDDELDLPKTLSFGYQIDMDVLEGDQTPSDQGMFRPFGQCWREFMASLAKQCHAIGPRVHVLRLDAKRYYDSIQRFVVRDALLTPLNQALAAHGVPEGLGRIFGLPETSVTAWDAALEARLESLLVGLIFHHEYRDPDAEGKPQRSSEFVGIPQGPVLSAYIGTIALFPVDEAARDFIHRTAEKGPDNAWRPRAGYARYVDDIVLFADSEDLLKQLRELLQAKAAERSIDLIHKGERVRAGSPQQVVRQLNDGRGLAPSVPAWEPPLVGDGETDYSLGGELPEVDRQCALQMLRRVALMHEPREIAAQVKAVLGAPDLRAGDLGLCARWLWWQVAATVGSVATPESLWERFWELWNEVCGEHPWASAFAQRGYHWLFAVEGLDKLLDNHPWQEIGKFLTEREGDRKLRLGLAHQVCEPAFIAQVKPATNNDHVLRRARMVVRKAHRLLGNSDATLALPPQQDGPLTAIEWLCLAGPILAQQDTDHHPLNALRERRPKRSSNDGLLLAHEVIDQLAQPNDEGSALLPNDNAPDLGLAIDFVINSSPSKSRLATLASWFPGLLSEPGLNKQLIPHLPTVSETASSLFAIDADTSADGRFLYRYSLRASDSPPSAPGIQQRFVQVAMHAEPPYPADETTVRFVEVESVAQRLVVAKSAEPRPWIELALPAIGTQDAQVPITHRAVRFYHALLTMHQKTVDGGRRLAYVPFRPQLFQQVRGDETTLYLLAERVESDQLGVNAWYHDLDGRVQSVTVPFAGAELWRVGWAVADVLGVAADMGGETGERDEQLDERKTPGDEAGSTEAIEAQAKQEIEAYVLRQQLRKLQGSYLSSSKIDSMGKTEADLPRTVKRALASLQKFPAYQGLEAQVRHLLEVEAESRAMVLRLEHGSGDDMRHVLHRVFPEALNRLPLWVLQGLPLQPRTGQAAPVRPELGLMLALYQVLYPATHVAHDGNDASLRVALALTAVGIGLRGSVAALWGYAQASGAARMPERLNLPPRWDMADMERLDPQGDYSAIRKRLLDGDWPALCKASPWQWMLALIGLLDVGLPQAFELQDLMSVYQALAQWQTAPADGIREEERAEEREAIWPFDALPTFPLQHWDEVMAALPKALCALDALRGMRVVNVEGQKFGRHPHTDDFTDASGASWQMSTPQFTSLFANTLSQRSVGRRKLTLWSETRSSSVDDELLAVHTLDHKLGRWFSVEDFAPGVPQAARRPHHGVPGDASVQRAMTAEADEALPAIPSPGKVGESAQRDQAVERSEPSAPAAATTSGAERVDRLEEWQRDSWSKRFGTGRSIEDEDLTAHGHLRVALFQWRVDDSYSHPIAEVGLRGVPFAPAAQKELQAHLDGDFKAVDRAAKRGAEFHWKDDREVLSWPEHRRRVLLGQALRACRELKVQLLVLPEVSVRPDTVKWLKDELLHHPGLAVLAGTFRQFEAASNHTEHLKEKLTLLWQPAKAEADAFGLQGDDRVMQFQRDKKYRAVAAHELFCPSSKVLAPLYQEDEVLEQLRGTPGRTWTMDQLKALMQALIHGPQKLRYCMELICSELFLLTSPANRRPLLQDLAKVLRQFGVNATDAAELVNRDLQALGELLTVTQANRERRSVLLVPACTSRSNDYWHAGQASVLASGTASVFCNAVIKGLSVGGSCFIGCDSVQTPKEHPGIVRLPTPYHGWHHGILQPSCQGALSEADQALVVVDLDPVHLVSGKPRPQLLPETVSMVAYLPIVEVLRKEDNARALVAALRNQLKGEEGCQTLERLLTAKAFPAPCEALHNRELFDKALAELLSAKRGGSLRAESGGPALDAFAGFFSDPASVRQRIMACLQDHHQQPAPLTKADGLDLMPAWLDFLVADLTWKQPDDERLDDEQARHNQPAIRVPPWQHVLGHLDGSEGGTRGGDSTTA